MLRCRQKCVFSAGSSSCFAIASRCDASCCHGRKPSSACKLKPSFMVRKNRSLSLSQIRWTIPFLAICFRKVCPFSCQRFIRKKRFRRILRQFQIRLCMCQFKTTAKRKRELDSHSQTFRISNLAEYQLKALIWMLAKVFAFRKRMSEGRLMVEWKFYLNHSHRGEIWFMTQFGLCVSN